SPARRKPLRGDRPHAAAPPRRAARRLARPTAMNWATRPAPVRAARGPRRGSALPPRPLRRRPRTSRRRARAQSSAEISIRRATLTPWGCSCHIRPMSTIRTVCVYCGSGPGGDPAFVAAARTFGRILAESGVRLVYGGGSRGLMGALANAVIDHGGEVIGIISAVLNSQEEKVPRAQEIIVTPDMDQTKQLMVTRGGDFLSL